MSRNCAGIMGNVPSVPLVSLVSSPGLFHFQILRDRSSHRGKGLEQL